MKGSRRHSRGSALGGWLLLLLAALTPYVAGSAAHAQTPPAIPESVEPPPQLRLILPGDRITERGFLVPPEDMAWFHDRIELLEFRLRVDVQAANDSCDARLTLQREVTRAAEDRHAVIVAAYDADRAALSRQIEEERAEVRRAVRAQHAWFRSPTLWFAVGVVTTGSMVLALHR
jgi:hypothetical protein